jgi:hypothetical protein
LKGKTSIIQMWKNQKVQVAGTVSLWTERLIVFFLGIILQQETIQCDPTTRKTLK